ncbi:MAG TPA: HD domain-containing protein [Dictyobacter sp.]|nr:HD domain-containing protein [Dictyobacter sp.]
MQSSIEEINWETAGQPTNEEIRLSGGLLVEDWPHARHVMQLSVQLFEATFPLHHFGERELRLLQRAAFLHNTGMMVDARRHHKHSFRLIKDSQLPDFTAKERYEIACIARYHRRALPNAHHEEFAALSKNAQKRVCVLAALLRVADAFDFNHDGRVSHIIADADECDRKVWTLQVFVRPLADLDVELEHARDKADLFEKVFHRKLRFLTSLDS